MPSQPLRHHRIRNGLQSAVLIVAILAILGLAAELFFGEGAFLPTTLGVLLALLIPSRIQPATVLRWHGVYRLSPQSAPGLIDLITTLAARADLPRPPELYYLPTPALNAFTIGSRHDAAIVISDGLLTMSARELAGILAHEVSHLRHADLFVMRLAETARRMTGILAVAGFFLLLLNLPLIALDEQPVSWSGILLLMTGPSLATLLQLALSRTREYDADLGAAELTGDPEGLAMALAKLERVQSGWLERMTRHGVYTPLPRALQTHPPTRERIRRLLSLPPRGTPIVQDADPLLIELPSKRQVRPRWWF